MIAEPLRVTAWVDFGDDTMGAFEMQLAQSRPYSRGAERRLAAQACFVFFINSWSSTRGFISFRQGTEQAPLRLPRPLHLVA
eukprot:3556162-Rhodomonas_salina.1